MRLKKLVLVGMAVLSIAAVSACEKKSDVTQSSTVASKDKAKTKESTATAETTAAVERPDDYGSAELGNYIGVEIPNIDTTVTDEEVQTQIDNELKQDPNKEQVTDRPVQDGDIVNIDYTGTKDGVAFDGGTAQGYDLVIGSGSFIKGFESGLIGHNVGEDVKLDLTFPADYGNADLAGAAVVFDVKINSISVSKDAELNDEWVNRHTGGESTTVDAYRESVRARLEKQKKTSAESQTQYNAIAAVIETSTFNMNDSAIDYEYSRIYAPIESMITQYNMDLDSYAQAYGMTADQLKEVLKTQAENYVKQTIVTREIYDKEKMTLTDADYQTLIDINGGGITKDELIQQYGQEDVDEMAKGYKVVNFIIKNAKRTDVTLNVTGETISGGESTEAQTSAAESSGAN